MSQGQSLGHVSLSVDRLDTVEADLSDLQSETGARDTVDSLCAEFSSYSGAFFDIYIAAC
jgi:hypothetical protein